MTQPKQSALRKYLSIQQPMLRVCAALVPTTIFSIYLFGWRALFLLLTVLVFGTATEAAFVIPQKRPITSAVFVTCMIFTLSLPPAVPFWIAAIGIITGVAFGKMIFGGFGRNVFNPAMVGRCFIYVCFPVQMTSGWLDPIKSTWGALGSWIPGADALSSATPLVALKESLTVPFRDLFLGFTSGSLGETSALLIILGGIYIIWRKAASWKLVVSCVGSGVVFTLLLHPSHSGATSSVLNTLLAGSFLFGSMFVVTEPVTAPNTNWGKWVYGAAVGALTVVLRRYSNFPEGMMFSVLIMNTFVPLIDRGFTQLSRSKRTS